MDNPALILLTAPECHLCTHAREVLETLRLEFGFDWSEVSTESAEGGRLAVGAPPLRPVLFASDGRPLAAGRLSKKRLRRDLTRIPKRPCAFCPSSTTSSCRMPTARA